MVQVIDSGPSFGSEFGRALGNLAGTAAGATHAHYKEKDESAKFKRAFGFTANREQRDEFMKELGKTKARQSLLESVRSGRGQGSTAQDLRGQMPEDDKKRQFLEVLPHIEQAIGRELNPNDLDKIWAQMDESPAGQSLQKMQPQRQREEDPFQEAEDLALVGLTDVSKVATERAKSSQKIKHEERKEAFGQAKPTLERGRQILEQLPSKETALEGMKESISSGNLGMFSLDNLAELTGLEGLRSPEGAMFKTQAKEFFLGNLSRIGAKGLNQMMERVVMDMSPLIGRSTEANLAVSEVLEAENDVGRKEAELINQLGQDYKEKHGQYPEDLQYRVYKELSPYAKERQKEALKRIDKIKEKYEPNNKQGVLMYDPAGNLRRVPHKSQKEAKREGYRMP